MLEFNVSQAVSAGEEATAADIVRAALLGVPAKLIGLIVAGAPEIYDRYADLRSKCRTPSAHQLVHYLREELEQLEQKTGLRVHKRRAKSGAKLTEALERIVGDLLRARAGTNTTGRIFRSVGKSSFRDVPVKYDSFMRVIEPLKSLGFVGHRKGQTRIMRPASSQGTRSPSLVALHASGRHRSS